MRAGILVAFLAVAAYANSVGNDFAYDDDGILTQNPTVVSGDWAAALSQSWWPNAVGSAGLYRPLTSASFAAEWSVSGGSPRAFHAVNVAVHALVSLLVFALLLALGTRAGAFAGGALFAIHPVHTEAVANVVGRAELYAALFYLLACLLYWHGRRWTGLGRSARLVALGGLYLLSLSSKEIGVTLPAALVLLEVFGATSRDEERSSLRASFSREAATFVLLGVVLAAYLGARFLVLGTVAGDQAAPLFQLVGPVARVLTAIAVWAQYARLLLFPLDLVSDYDPAVIFPSEGLDVPVLLGGAVLVGLGVLTFRARKSLPLVSLGVLFFAVAVLPVSNLLFSTGTVLAERTLYLPSVGLSLVLAAVTVPVLSLRVDRRRWLIGAAMLVGVALFIRTVTRNPAWMSTFVVQQTLNEDHPESWRAFRARAQGLVRVGNVEQAGQAWDQAAALAPTNYTLLVQAALFHDQQGSFDVAEAYLRRAVPLASDHPNPYQHLSLFLLRRGRGREGHAVALEGLARAGGDRELWALLSESYLQKGDLAAAIHAREAAVGVDPSSFGEWGRLADIRLQAGDTVRAAQARARADSLALSANNSEGIAGR
jgi:protein O-mannosyl-transferase